VGKYAGRAQKKEDSAINEADNSEISKPGEAPEDLDKDSKGAWFKRQKKADKEAKKGAKVKEEWYELQGYKLLRKARKVNGGVYSFYVCNIRKHPEALDNPKIRESASGESLLNAIKKRSK